MISTEKRQWITTPRFNSRLLLRGLIAFNIVLAVYNIIKLQSNTRNTDSRATPKMLITKHKISKNM